MVNSMTYREAEILAGEFEALGMFPGPAVQNPGTENYFLRIRRLGRFGETLIFDRFQARTFILSVEKKALAVARIQQEW